VRKVVDAKVDDGQLDDADLTLADIEKIIQVYSKMLTANYHSRIEYPDMKVGGALHARADNESSRP
jgi:membrane-associated HD superfamily phosphohydrolase